MPNLYKLWFKEVWAPWFWGRESQMC